MIIKLLIILIIFVPSIVTIVLYKRKIKEIVKNYNLTCTHLENSYMNGKQEAMADLTKEKNKIITNLQSMLEKESAAKADMHKRVRELEDGVRQGTGISLRNEVTKVDVPFDINELSAMMNGLYFLIEKQYNKLDDVKYIVALLDKLRNAVINMQKEPDQKGNA